MTLSGWTRLWIVASLAIWIGGFFWLQSASYVQPGASEVSDTFPFRMPTLQPDYSVCALRPAADDTNPFAQFGGHPQCRAYVLSDWNFAWGHWIAQSSKAGHLQLVVFGPLVLGALMLGAGWVRKGFAQQPPAKKDSSASP